jgi:hypothetical protein
MSDRQTVTGAVGQTKGQIDIQTVKEIDRQTDKGRTERKTDKGVKGQTDKQRGERTDRQTKE